MMLYALGALEAFDGIYDIKTIRMTIFQPRRENIATDEISKEELLRWAKENPATGSGSGSRRKRRFSRRRALQIL